MYTVRWAATAIARPCARGGRGTRAELTVRREADTQVGWLAAVRAPPKAETNNRNRQGPLSQAASAASASARRRRRRPTSRPASASASAGAPAYYIRCNTSTWAVQRQARAAAGVGLSGRRATQESGFACSAGSAPSLPCPARPCPALRRPNTTQGDVPLQCTIYHQSTIMYVPVASALAP
jgi:hypothetical protein